VSGSIFQRIGVWLPVPVPVLRGWRGVVRASRSADSTPLVLSCRSGIARTRERNCWKCGAHYILWRLRTLMRVVLHRNSVLSPSHHSVETRSRRESTQSSGRGQRETGGIHQGGVSPTQSGRWDRQVGNQSSKSWQNQSRESKLTGLRPSGSRTTPMTTSRPRWRLQTSTRPWLMAGRSCSSHRTDTFCSGSQRCRWRLNENDDFQNRYDLQECDGNAQ